MAKHSPAVEKAMARFYATLSAMQSRVKPPKTRLQKVAREVRQIHGMELTPQQVEESLNSAIATVRLEMMKKGHSAFATMSAEDVYAEMRKAFRKGS